MLYDTPQDPEEFDRHYREIHVPLTKKIPGLRRYTLSRNTRVVRGERPYYLVAEMEWDDMAALQAAFASPEGIAAGEDVEKFAGDGVTSLIFEVEDA